MFPYIMCILPSLLALEENNFLQISNMCISTLELIKYVKHVKYIYISEWL